MNQKLIDEISIDLESMEIIVQEIKNILAITNNANVTNIYKTALGGFASQFYNGIENILKRILKHSSINLPVGDNWHIELLNMFSQTNYNKYQLKFSINDELLEELSNYRRFRHYFFHGYSHNLNWDILKDGIKNIEDVFNQFKNILDNSYCK